MRASKPAPAITAKRSPLTRPTSMRRVRPARPMSTACSMSLGMPRFVASRFAVPAGMIARLASVPASTSTQRCTMPSPPHTKMSSALRASAFSTCLGANRLLPTSRQNTSVTPRSLEHAPQLRQAAAERLPAVRDHGDARHARAPAFRGRAPARDVAGDAVGGDGDRERCEADQHARGGVDRVVHAAVHARQRDDQRQRDRDRPRRDREPAPPPARRDQQREPDVDDDRGGDVPGRVALVDGQVIEARHVRALAMHDQARDAVGRDLDEDRAHDQPKHTPAPQDGRAKGEEDDEAGDERDVADRRADVGRVRQRTAAVVGEPVVDGLVVVPDRVHREQHVDEQEAEPDRERGEQHVADQRREDEGHERRAPCPTAGQRAGAAAGAGDEDRGLGRRARPSVATRPGARAGTLAPLTGR